MLPGPPKFITDLQLPPKHIAVVGLEVSGKDTYASHLESKGYFHVAAGDFLRAQARLRGYAAPFDRAVLSKVGDELKIMYGPSPIVIATLEAQASELSVSFDHRIRSFRLVKETLDPMLEFEVIKDYRLSGNN